MLPPVCFETGRFSLTQSSWTVIRHCSRKWMSGQAAALAPLHDRWRLANLSVLSTLRELSLPSARRPPSPFDFYLSWMSPGFSPQNPPASPSFMPRFAGAGVDLQDHAVVVGTARNAQASRSLFFKNIMASTEPIDWLFALLKTADIAGTSTSELNRDPWNDGEVTTDPPNVRWRFPMRMPMKWCAMSLVQLSATFCLAAGVTVTLSPAIGPPTTKVQVSGAGFPAATAIDIYIDTTDETLAVTTATGTFSGIVVQVPASAVPGSHWITAVARGTSGKAAQTAFTVQTNWFQHAYSPIHKGANPYENVLSPTTVGSIDLDWSYTAGAGLDSSPAIVNGVVYIASSDCNLYAINATSGSLLWKTSLGVGSFFIFSTPAVANGVVYVGSADNNLYAVNATNGNLLWKFATGGPVGSSPAVVGGNVYFGSWDGNVYAVNASTGIQSWKFTTGNSVDSSPAVANGVVYIGSYDAHVYALSASTGAQLWNFTTGSAVESAPAVANGVVYVASDDFNLYALNAHNGAQVWATSTANWQRSSPAVANGVVYVGTENHTLCAVNANTGSVLWTFATGDIIQAPPTVANGVVYVGGFDSKVYALQASNGALLWQYVTGGQVYSSPTVVNGVLYVGSNDSNLYSLDLSGSTLAPSFKAPPRPNPTSLRPNLSLQPSQSVERNAT